jgi:hypothetical protein
VIEVTTPFGEVLRQTSTRGGKRCVDVTNDIGLAPRQFAQALGGACMLSVNLPT